VIDFLVCLSPPFRPFCENSPVFLDRTVEFCCLVFCPCPLAYDLGFVQLVGIELPAETKLAGDELVDGEDDELDVIAILVVLKLEQVAFVSFPAQLGGAVEVEELDIIGFSVNQEVPWAYIAVDDAEAEVEVIHHLRSLISIAFEK